MKKALLICSIAACVALSVSADNTPLRHFKYGKKNVPEAIMQGRVALEGTAANPVWRAGKVTTFSWNITDYQTSTGQWTELNYYIFTHDDAGRNTSSTLYIGGAPYARVDYDYDSENRCIRITYSYYQGNDCIPQHKLEYAYDSIVKNFITDELDYLYNNGSWTLTYSERSVITRNSDNNVISLVEQEYNPNTSSWVDEEKFEITYGADKKASTIRIYEYEYGRAELEAEITDIVWEQTDGQIVDTFDDNEDFFMGTNRMKSARCPKATNYPYIADIFYNVTYKPDNGGFNMVATMNNSTYMSTDYTVLDDNGSYTSEEYEVDYDEENGSYVYDGASLESITYMYDAFRLMTKKLGISYINGNKANGIEYKEETTGTVVYDTTYGYPLEYITAITNDAGVAVNSERLVYSDYSDVNISGLDHVNAADNAPMEYFNLQGVRIENPSNGLFIRRQGNSVTKVMIR